MEEAIGLLALIAFIIIAIGGDNLVRLIFGGIALIGGGFLLYRFIQALERRPVVIQQVKTTRPPILPIQVRHLIEEVMKEIGITPRAVIVNIYISCIEKLLKEWPPDETTFASVMWVLKEGAKEFFTRLPKTALGEAEGPLMLPPHSLYPPGTVYFNGHFFAPDFVYRMPVSIWVLKEKIPDRRPSPDACELSTVTYGSPSRNGFDALADIPIPIRYTNEKRFEHTQIVGGTGAGKTNFLSHLILFDLHQDNPPGIVLIDPKRLVIDKLSHLAIFNEKLKDRLIIVSPRYKPAINVFDTRTSGAGAIETLTYLFSMLGTELTGRQRIPFQYVARLMLAFPQTMGRNATLLDLYDIMTDGITAKYQPAVEGLGDIQRRFFEKGGGFTNREFNDTKEQIRVRLDGLLANPDLESLFTSQHNKVDIFEELQKGSIILVDTAIDKLGPSDSKLFGCIFISQVLQAINDRVGIPEGERKPAFMYVDEAADFFNTNIEYFLTAARQCKVGGIFAYHNLTQCSDTLKASMFANTSTKIVSKRATDPDARAFAPYLRMDAEAIRDLPEYHFACTITGVVEPAVSITAPYGQIDNEPKMSEEAYQALLRRNVERVSGEQRQREQPRQEQPKYDARQEQPRQQEEPPEQPPPKWMQADDLALADAYAQLAVAVRRGDTKRAAELREHIDDLLDRKEASDDYYGDADERQPSQGLGVYEPKPESQPRRKRKRPRKRRGPLTGEIDTSA